METKKCANCKKEKPKKDFCKNRQQKSGFHPYCRPCQAEIQREYRKKKKKGQATAFYTFEYYFPELCKESLEYSIAEHFYRMRVILTKEELNQFAADLKNAGDGFYKKLDELEKLKGAGPENYLEMSIADLLQQDRIEKAKQYNTYRGSAKKKILQFSKEGEFIAQYDSVADSSEAISGSRKRCVGVISLCARGIEKFGFGFIWDYLDEFENKFAD
jgi:hypothetical protein